MAVVENDHTPTEPVIGEPKAALPDYLTSPDAVLGDAGALWRYGRPPDYSRTRKNWQESKKMDHATGSLPQLVENLVKNWEIEASFKPRLEDWRTIDHDNYTFAMNGGSPQPAAHMLKVGTYNAIIASNEYYGSEYSDFASSHKTFKRMMPTFAWEVIEVYSGPPTVSFKWRHWGEMKNDYVGFNEKGEKVTAKAHGGPIEIFGVSVAKVDEKTRIQAIDTWMDPLDMFRHIAPHGIIHGEETSQNFHDAQEHQDDVVRESVKVASDASYLADQHLKDLAAEIVGREHIYERTEQHIDGPGSQQAVCPFLTVSPTEAQANNADAADLGCGSSAIGTSEVERRVHITFSIATDQGQPEIYAPTMDSGSARGPTPSGHVTPSHGTAHSTAHSAAMASDLTAQQDSTNGLRPGHPHVDDVASEYPEHPTPLAMEQLGANQAGHVHIPGSTHRAEKSAKRDAIIHEPFSSGTHGVINEHIKRHEIQVHGHTKDFEDDSVSLVGEAITAPASSEETRMTHEEMSNIDDDECSNLMNRE